MRERIAQTIAAYDRQGIHRTGTDVDGQSAEWLAGQVRELGGSPRLEPFSLSRVDIDRAELHIGRTVIDGVPAFDGGYTDTEGLSGAAGSLGSDAAIGFRMTLPYEGSEGGQAIREARRTGRHRAIVAVTDDRMPDSGPAVFNAESFLEPYGPPVLQVAHRHWDLMQRAAAQGETVRVIAAVSRANTTASNVEVTVPGDDPHAAPIVVMTPRSGWWQCASARGGGIATWLEILKAVTASPLKRTVHFTANSGHELHHIGLDDYLAARPSLVKEARLWVHLGANYAAKGSNVRLQYSDEESAALVASARGKLAPAAETPIGQQPYGEARNIFDGNGRFISLLGDNPLFHHPADRWPDAVDLDAATAWTEALVNVVLNVANAP